MISVMVLVSTCAFLFMLYIFYNHVSAKYGLLLFFLGIMPVAFLGAALSRLPIAIDDSGVSVLMFGVSIKKLRWESIRKITKTNVPVGYGRFTNRFHINGPGRCKICGALPNIAGDIVFSSDIQNCGDLISNINAKAKRYSIPLYARDYAAKPRNAAEISGRLVGKIPEAKVSEF